ncbi:hypothetical protein JCM19037_2270 [Geomicrobium sp. JCM 19037]|uniref:sce7725 family protein n=1 Tax=Geomicrobium sp. JCM 19037 TaxID=1460634 RepID=UPI00045F3C22|nr:sce7725 family protein [Geomicrobium sp. JCM 19037]GAK03909.1 hypothetical protein JCM19037_2270 [Geomicrobium sp. JCM 19037]
MDINELAVLHSNRKYIEKYKEYTNQDIAYVNIVPTDNPFRRQLNRKNLVGLADRFNKQGRNIDYRDNMVEFFSEEHLFYKDEGYIGFSDYSVIGAEYSESGFAPYAVAIHIVYPTEENTLEIIHFVSDSNEDIRDPAGKFSEALHKLIKWYQSFNDSRIETFAIGVFKEHYENGTYPGLPTLKKLSIMHHLELIGKLYNGRSYYELLYKMF